MNLFKGPFVLKIAALFFAIGTYFYIHQQVISVEKEAPDPSYKLIKLTAKNLELKARIVSEPPEGYHVIQDQVTTVPWEVVVIGPEALLEEAETVETALLDVSENTKTVTKEIPLESVAGIHLSGQPYYVHVTIPIEKIQEEPQAPDEPGKPSEPGT